LSVFPGYTICPADNATAGSLGWRRAGQLRFGFVAVSAGHIVFSVIYLLMAGKMGLALGTIKKQTADPKRKKQVCSLKMPAAVIIF
jgi:hypothetical protein